MTYSERLLPEFDQEMASTRRVLERVPEDKLEWKAHAKSHTIGWNANHVADLPNWMVVTLTEPLLDIAPVGGQPYKFANLTRRKEILDLFDKNVAAARKALVATSDEAMNQPWTLQRAGKIMFTMPRSAVVRSVILNHIMHHRAHLCVYLRMNDIPVPGMYGPSGDE